MSIYCITLRESENNHLYNELHYKRIARNLKLHRPLCILYIKDQQRNQQSIYCITSSGSQNNKHLYIGFQCKRITRNLRLRRPQRILSGAHAKPNGVDTRDPNAKHYPTSKTFTNCASCYQDYRSSFGLTNHIKGELIGQSPNQLRREEADDHLGHPEEMTAPSPILIQQKPLHQLTMANNYLGRRNKHMVLSSVCHI